jgi:hypothetical protein
MVKADIKIYTRYILGIHHIYNVAGPDRHRVVNGTAEHVPGQHTHIYSLGRA